MPLVTLQDQLECSRTGCMIVVLGWWRNEVGPMLRWVVTLKTTWAGHRVLSSRDA